MKKIVGFIIILLGLILVHPYLSPQFPYTHDAENHLARFANYKLAVKEGQLPPRFAPNLFNHYGYPVFNYNYPLANIISLPFSFLRMNYEVTFKLQVIGAVLVGLIGIWMWLGFWTKQSLPRLIALLAFTTSPYVFQTVAIRGGIGEIWALMLIPWILAFVESIVAGKLFIKVTQIIWPILLLTAFFLAHNVTVAFSLPFILLYAVFRLQNNWLGWKKLLLISTISILLSLWFWLPAVLEKNLVILDGAQLSQGFMGHFPTLNQLLFSPLSSGFSYNSPVDSLSFSLGIFQLFTLIGGSLYFLKRKAARTKEALTFGGALVLAWIPFLAQLKVFSFGWSLVPFVHFIQFPWRLSLFFSIFILPIVVLVTNKLSKKWLVVCILILLLQLIPLIRFQSPSYFHHIRMEYDEYSQSTSTANENLPKNFTHPNTGSWQPQPEFLEGEGGFSIKKWNGSYHSYILQLNSPATIVEPTMNFSGWQTQVSSKENSESKLMTYLDSQQIGGRIAFQLSAGEYTVLTRFTQFTLWRVIGNLISGVTFLVLILVLAKEKFKKA
jgi:hypothetical protein